MRVGLGRAGSGGGECGTEQVADGYFVPAEWSLDAGTRVIAPLPEVGEALSELLEVIEQAPLRAELLKNPGELARLAAAAGESARVLPPAAQTTWNTLVERLRQPT